MRTARSLTWGVYLLGRCTCPGGVPAWGVYLPRGYLRGVVPARGCTYLGGVPAQGVYLPGGYLPGGYLPRGCTCPGTPLPPVDRILDTRYWKHYLAPTSLRAVMSNYRFEQTFTGHLWGDWLLRKEPWHVECESVRNNEELWISNGLWSVHCSSV